MSRIKHLVFRKGTNAAIEQFIVELIREDLVSWWDEGEYLVIGRHKTNKERLKRWVPREEFSDGE